MVADNLDLNSQEFASAEARTALDDADPREIVDWALRRFDAGRLAIVTSLQAGGVALVDMAARIDPSVRVVTIDTGRLPRVTVDYLDLLRERLPVDIEVLSPDATELAAFVGERGADSIFESPERRLECCHIRKVAPLDRLLAGLSAWITGLRRDQSGPRARTPVVEVDDAHGGIIKLNPLARWTAAQVDGYLAERRIPAHPLYELGYRSIGCDPCTRAVGAGEDARAGRWWWETGVSKECGIHERAVAPLAGRST